jgi:hypothetical protein
VALSSDGNTALIGGFHDNKFARPRTRYARSSRPTTADTGPHALVGNTEAKVSLLVDAAAPTAGRASTPEFVGDAAAPPGTRFAVPPA